MNNRFDLTHNLENIVYNDLIYMGYEVYVYNNSVKAHACNAWAFF